MSEDRTQTTLASYSPAEPLLLFTDFAPDFAGGGAVILRSLLPKDHRRSLLWVSPSPGSARASGRVAELSVGKVDHTGRRSTLLDMTVFARSLSRELLAQAAAARAQAVWVVLHGSGVPVAAELMRQNRLPVHITVHDDPTFGVALRSRRYLLLVPWLEHCVARALAGARSVDVISEGMRRRYVDRYGVQSFVVHRAVSGPIAPSQQFDAARGLRVGVLGNTYAYAQLPVLAKAIALAARTLAIPGTLAFIGRGLAARLRREIKPSSELAIEEHGHLEEADAIPLLREQFLLYLNYPFGWRHAVLRQTSFPTKLSTYVLASRPLLVHAPEDSTIAGLGSKWACALSWTSMSAEEGAETLIAAWRDPRMHESVHEFAERIRVQYFDPERNQRALATALNTLVHPIVKQGTGSAS